VILGPYYFRLDLDLSTGCVLTFNSERRLFRGAEDCKATGRSISFVMAETAEPLVLPDVGREEETDPKDALEPGFLVICWDDPINLMDYVTHVFRTVFGWPKQKAEFHMLQVHNQGKSVLVRDSMEKAEHYVHQLQKYSLHATMERDE
jgi:ATP-dependent Clp protease adaptor protein ClpS